jgi:predicted amidohydrolase
MGKTNSAQYNNIIPAKKKASAMTEAIENQSHVIGVNRVGEDGNGINYSGDSVILDYLGQPLAQTTANTPAILTAEISLTDLQGFREKFPAHLDADEFELR